MNHLLLSGGSWSGGERNHLFLNKQGQQFEELSGVSGIDDAADARSFVVWDYDHDGWQDFAVVNRNSPKLRLFRNRIGDSQGSASARTIAIRFVGGNHSDESREASSNRDGYGARVSVSIGTRVLTREHLCGQGLAAQNSSTMLVGIGAEGGADQVRVRWPSGKAQESKRVPAGTLLTVYEDPSQSPTGEAFVKGEYQPARPRQNSEEPRADVYPPLALQTIGSQNESQLRIYTTMATWCAACARKLPAVGQMRSQFSESELAMYGVPVDENDKADVLTQWVDNVKPAYEVATNASSEEIQQVKDVVLSELKADILPATIVTDATGHVLHVQGGFPSISKMRELLDKSAQ